MLLYILQLDWYKLCNCTGVKSTGRLLGVTYFHDASVVAMWVRVAVLSFEDRFFLLWFFLLVVDFSSCRGVVTIARIREQWYVDDE